MTTEKDESFFHSVVTKTVDGFVVSSSGSGFGRGGKIIFPSNPSLLPNKAEESTLQSKEKSPSGTFVVPTWFTKLTQRYVERQKRFAEGMAIPVVKFSAGDNNCS